MSDECHEISGQCNCRPGLTGRDCSKCSERNVIIGKVCTSCDDHCTGTMLNELEFMYRSLEPISIDPNAAIVWRKLFNFDAASKEIFNQAGKLVVTWKFLQDLPMHKNLVMMMTTRASDFVRDANGIAKEVNFCRASSERSLNKITTINMQMRNAINMLKDHMSGSIIGDVNPIWVKNEVEAITDSMRAVSIDIGQTSLSTENELADANDIYDQVLYTLGSGKDSLNTWKRVREIQMNLQNLMDFVELADSNSEEVFNCDLYVWFCTALFLQFLII